MIYEMVDSCLATLANQWADLARAFQQLADTLPAGSGSRLRLDNNVAAPSVLRGLQQMSEDEEARIDGWRVANQNLRPALTLFTQAAGVFESSDTGLNAIGGAGWIPGRVWVEGEFKGTFGPNPSPADSVEVSLCRAQLEQLGGLIARCLQDFEEITSPEGQRFSLSGIRNSTDNLASYPVLTSEVNTLPPVAPALPGGFGGGGNSFQRTVDGALREVLGRMPRAGDPRSFVAALQQSFEIVHIEGHTEFKWTPRSYAGQTELGGGVTGAQASLYTRAKVSLDNSLPLLDGLYPLLPEYDPQLIEAARATLRTELTAVVNELSIEGGPRVLRVDDLFGALLGASPTPGVSGGHFLDLQNEFGLLPTRVNTLEEEVNLSNFVLLLDYTQSLQVSWVGFRNQFLGRDLGTRLVLLSRALSVTAESVQEVYAAMDSVFVGAAERQVAAFRDTGGRFVLVEELLSWVLTFATDEAPRLVYEGGRFGVGAIIQPAQRLEGLVEAFLQAIPNEPSLPDGLRHPRVRHPLQELRGYLRRVSQLAQDVRRP